MTARWPVILADPPWSFRNVATRAAPSYVGPARSERRYDVVAEHDLCTMAAAFVRLLAADNAVLFLWAPNALVIDGTATRVARAWGFEPKQLIPWIKLTRDGAPALGMGNYTRVCSEQLMLCRRGRIVVTARNVPGVIMAIRGRHSAKPDESYRLIESALRRTLSRVLRTPSIFSGVDSVGTPNAERERRPECSRRRNPMKIHPSAEIFPLMDDVELNELATDIANNGLHNPIVTLDGAILDGRNRYEACRRAEITPRTVEWDGNGSPTAYVLAQNLRRRHLSPAQRTAAAVKAMPLFEAEAKLNQRKSPGRGRGKGEPNLAHLFRAPQARDRAAAIAEVSPQRVQALKKVRAQAPEVFAAAERGHLNINQAVATARAPAPVRARVLDEAAHGAAPSARVIDQRSGPSTRTSASGSTCMDAEGREVPEHLRWLWQDEEWIEHVRQTISYLRHAKAESKKIKEQLHERSPIHKPWLSLPDLHDHLDRAIFKLQKLKPHAVCDGCNGAGGDAAKKSCCRNGWHNAHDWSERQQRRAEIERMGETKLNLDGTEV